MESLLLLDPMARQSDYVEYVDRRRIWSSRVAIVGSSLLVKAEKKKYFGKITVLLLSLVVL